MKKSILISEIFPPKNGGSGRWFWELYSRLPQESTFIVAGQHEDSEHFDKAHKLSLARLDLNCWTWGIKSVDGFKYYWKTFWSIKKLIKQHNIKSIHCGRCLPEGFMGYLLSKALGLPLLCYVHGEDVEAASQSRELSWMVKRVLNHCHTIICNSNNTASLLTNSWSISDEKIKVLNPGVDASKFIPAVRDMLIKAQLGWNDRPVVLTVGRLQKRKGHDMMVSALPKIKESIPNVLYAIIGGGEEKARLESLVIKNSVQDNVLFMDEIDDDTMLQCYQQCDLFILPNRTVGRDIEGFGMVLVEAQSCGKPVIAGNSGGTRETMVEEETGVVIDCTNIETIADTVCSMLKDKNKLQTMALVAREHVLTTLDWSAHVEKAKALFQGK